MTGVPSDFPATRALSCTESDDVRAADGVDGVDIALTDGCDLPHAGQKDPLAAIGAPQKVQKRVDEGSEGAVAGCASVCDVGTMTGRASLGVGRSVMVSVKSAPNVTALSKHASLIFAPRRFVAVNIA